MAEEQVASFVRELGHALLTQYVTTRSAQERRTSYWEEVKVGRVQVPGRTERLYTVRPTYGLETSFDDLFSLACLEGWTPQTRVRGIAAGRGRGEAHQTAHGGSFQ